jgi:hypothetical protein
MPRFRKLNSAQIAELEQRPISARAQVAREYDVHVADFAAGDYGRAELAAHERRTVVRGRLQAAAKRRGLTLRFRSGPGPLTFRVDTAPPSIAKAAPMPVFGAEQQRDGTPRRDDVPPRPPRRRQTATERYHEVLPRWMRTGQSLVRRGGSKQRHRQ